MASIGRLVPEEPAGLASLPADLQRLILGRVSEASQGFSHALVCRDWAALAASTQLSCACTCRGRGAPGEEAGKGVEASQLAQELSVFPNLTSLDITANELPDSFLSCLPESLQHLWVKGEREWETGPLLQGLLRFRELKTLCVLTHKIPSDAWPLSASLRHLDLGGVGEAAPPTSSRFSLARPSAIGTRNGRGSAKLPEEFLERISELRELRVFRAILSLEVSELPESMSRLTNLEELNLWACGLETLFDGIGHCQKLSRILINTWSRLILSPSLTQLPSLSFLYLSAEGGVQAPPGMGALTSLHTIEMYPHWHTGVSEADALFPVPSLQELLATGLPSEMSVQTSLRKLVLCWNPDDNYPDTMWALKSLRILVLQSLRLPAIPESVRGLSRLEELQVIDCCEIPGLPDSVAELPHLRKVVLVENPKLSFLPSSIGSWPSLQVLHLKDLPALRLPKGVLSGLRQLEGLRIDRCRKLKGTERKTFRSRKVT